MVGYVGINELKTELKQMILCTRDRFRERVMGQAVEVQFHSVCNWLNWDMDVKNYFIQTANRYKMRLIFLAHGRLFYLNFFLVREKTQWMCSLGNKRNIEDIYNFLGNYSIWRVIHFGWEVTR